MQIIERHIAFPTHPFDPPSSPPPTSPLPPLPEIALYGQHGSPVSTISPITPISTRGPPIRPPRPQTSLPNLQPRIIKSPDVSERQRHSSALAHTRVSPTPSIQRRKTPRLDRRVLNTPESRGSVYLAGSEHGSTPKLSDDALGALPRLFNIFSTSHLIHSDSSRRCEQLGRVASRQGFPENLSNVQSRTAQRRKRTRKPVARSALFIPSTPPKVASSDDVSSVVSQKNVVRAEDLCGSLSAIPQASMLQSIPERTSPLVSRQSTSTRRSHRRKHAVTSFAFGFDDSQGSAGSSTSNEKLTSLPRIPSDPILLVTSSMEEKDVTKRPCPTFSRTPDRCTEAVTFAALPYAHTLGLAGPRPETETDNKVRSDVNRNIEAGEEPMRQLTEEEVRSERRKRALWAITTIVLVLMATAGILIGIIWKLRALT